MARPARHALPGVPLHLVQRGIDRQPIFHTDRDRKVFLSALDGAARAHGVQVHSYVLMPNHVHLLVTGAQADSVSRMMQSLGRRYVRHVNDTHGRAGTLWDGRYKACLVDSGPWLMAVHRYIELNPVRAGLAAEPGDYRWSSFRHHALGEADPVVTPHAFLAALGEDAEIRRQIYRDLASRGLGASEIEAIRGLTKQGRAFGGAHFRSQVEAVVKRPMSYRRPGRQPNEVGVIAG